MTGSYFAFPKDKVLKRYQSKSNYLQQVRSVAQKLVNQGYLLDRDLAGIEKLSSAEWDFVTK